MSSSPSEKTPSPVEIKRPDEGYSGEEVTCEIVKVFGVYFPKAFDELWAGYRVEHRVLGGRRDEKREEWSDANLTVVTQDGTKRLYFRLRVEEERQEDEFNLSECCRSVAREETLSFL